MDDSERPTPTSPLPYPDEGAEKRRMALAGLLALAAVGLALLGVWLLGKAGLPAALGAWALALAGVVAAIVLAAKAQSAIARKEQAWVQSRGWTYVAKDTADIPSRFGGFRCFGKGHSRRATHVVRGTYWGMPFEAFRYTYEETHAVSDGKGGMRQQTTTYTFGMVAVPMPVSAPGLTIEPETVGKKLYDALGGSDIDFESDEFSRRFWVRCPDRRFAYAALDARQIGHLLDVGNARTWEWRGNWLLAWQRGGFGIRDLDRRLWEVQGFVARLPSVLTQPATPRP